MRQLPRDRTPVGEGTRAAPLSVHPSECGGRDAAEEVNEMTKKRTDEKAKYRNTTDGKLLYLPSTRTRQYLRGQVLLRPEQFRAEIEATDGTPKQQARRKYLKRLIANLRPNVMRQWYGSVNGPAPVTQRPMTDEERARYFPEGKW
jgi:hypothetical protein